MRLLLIEDDSPLRDALKLSLEASGDFVDAFADGDSADLALRSKHRYTAVVLDLGLPRRSGESVLRAMRSRGDTTPVLVLTAVDSLDTKVQILDIGADDYMVKPFQLRELEARLRVMIRRRDRQSQSVFRVGALLYDAATRAATDPEGTMIALTAKETALLEVLIRRAPNWVAKETLIEQMSEWDQQASANALEVLIHRLRKRLNPFCVEVVAIRGLGYLLKDAQ